MPWYAIRIRSTILSRVLRRVRGRISEVGEDRLWLWIGGVELEFLAPATTLSTLSPESETTLFATLLFREEGPLLFAFATEAERIAFGRLLGVNGVGPKAALALVGTLGPEGIALAVEGGDVQALTAAPGIGRKVAERVVLELKGKLPTPSARITNTRAVAEATEALLLLGFREAAVRRVVSLLAQKHPQASPEEIIRLALKELR